MYYYSIVVCKNILSCAIQFILPIVVCLQLVVYKYSNIADSANGFRSHSRFNNNNNSKNK